MGKGGVGKSTVAEATARSLAKNGKRTLLCHVLDIGNKEQKLTEISPNLFELTLNPTVSFREYVQLKLPVKGLVSLLLGSKVIQYLEKAAPGVRELVFMGKIWHERENYEHIIVDMPSTGYALTMLYTPFNFATLFPGGPIYHDTQGMIQTLSDPKETAFVTICLPEEMPIQETIELGQKLAGLMPNNPHHLIMNRVIEMEDEAAKRASAQNEAKNPFQLALELMYSKFRDQQQKLEQFRKEAKWFSLPEIHESSETAITHAIQGYLEAKA